MQKQPVEELIISSKRRSGYKRPAESGEENYPVPKKRCRYVLICPMEKEFSLLPQNRECNYFSTDEEKIPWEDMPVTSRHSCSTAEPSSTDTSTNQPIHQPKKTLTSRKGYNPFDFTSDELNPTYEWLRNSSSAEKCVIDPTGLLRSVLSPFPLGLRLNKLKNMVWSKHNIQLLTLSLQQGFKDSLHFLEAVPGIILKFNHRRPFRCIVQLDQAAGKVSD